MNNFNKKILSISILLSASSIPSSKVFATLGNKHISISIGNVANLIREQKSASGSFVSGLRRSIRKPSGDVSTSKFAHSYYKESIDMFNNNKAKFNSKMSNSGRLISLEEAVSNIAAQKLHLESYTLIEQTGSFVPNLKVINESKNIPKIFEGKITNRGFIAEESINNGRYDLVKVLNQSEISFTEDSSLFSNKVKSLEKEFKENFPALFSNTITDLNSQERSLLSLSRAYSSKLGIESLTNEDLVNGSNSSKNAHTLFKAELIVGNRDFVKWLKTFSKESLPSIDRKILNPILDKIWSKNKYKNLFSSSSDISISNSSDTTIKGSKSSSNESITGLSTNKFRTKTLTSKEQCSLSSSSESIFEGIISEDKKSKLSNLEEGIGSLKSDISFNLGARPKEKLSERFNKDLSSIEETSEASSMFSLGDRSSFKVNSKRLSRLDSVGKVSIYETASDEDGAISSITSSDSFQSLKDGEPVLYDKGYMKVPGTDNYMEKMVYQYKDKEGFLTLYVEEQEQISKVVEVSPRVYSYVVPEDQKVLFNNMKKDLVVEAKNKLGQTKRVVIQSLTLEDDGIEGVYAYQLDQGLWREVVVSQNGIYYLGDVVKYENFGSKVQGKLRKLAKFYNTFGAPVVGAGGGISRTISGLI